jgi:hypothetical protein
MGFGFESLRGVIGIHDELPEGSQQQEYGAGQTHEALWSGTFEKKMSSL